MFQDKRRPFLEAFNTYIDNYIYRSWKDIFEKKKKNKKKNKKKKLVDLSEYKHINERYKHPSRLFSSWWTYVKYIDYEQFIHDSVDWMYTLKTMPLPNGTKLKSIFVPKIFVKKNKQDTIFYI